MRFLKPSQRLPSHSVIAPQFLKIAMTATTTAMTPAITPMIGSNVVINPPIAGITVVVITAESPPPAPIAPMSPPIPPTSVPITVIIEPIADIKEPKMMSTGPSTARSIPALIMNCCVSGLSPFHHSATFLSPSARSSRIGASVSPIVPPTSDRASLS